MIDVSKIAKNFFSITAMRVLTSVFSFIFFSVLARKWGAEALGEFSTLFSVFMFLLQLPLLGLHIVLARNIASTPESVSDETINALVLSLGVAFVMIFLVGFSGQLFYSEKLHASFWLVGVATLFMAVTAVAEAVLIGQEKMDVIARANIGENIFRVFLGAVLVFSGFGLTPVIFVFSFGRLIAVLIYLTKGKIWELARQGTLSLHQITTYLKKCPTFFGILLLSVIVGRFDFIVLSLMGTMREVGLYSPAFKVYEIGLMVPSMLAVVLFPAFSRCFEHARDRFESLYLNVFRFALALGAPLVVILANSSELLINIIFGQQYTGGSPALELLSLAILFSALDQVFAAMTLAGHREDLELKALFYSCLLYLALLFILIPVFGFMGAAITTTVISFFKMTLRYYWIKREFNIPGAGPLVFRPVIAVLPLILFLYLMRDVNILLASVLALVVYGLVLYAIKGITRSQLLAFRQVFAGN